LSFELNRCALADCRETLRGVPDGVFACCVTSPPYWGLRDYGHPGQLGLESTPAEYVENLVGVFREVRRTLRDDGTLWLNLGDSYASNPASGGRSESSAFHGSPSADTDHATPARAYVRPAGLKPKDLVGIPWMVAFALRADGWWLRSDIIWAKPNPMPESVTDRPTKSHEYVFLLAKSERYFYDAKAICDPAIFAGTVKDYTGDQKANSVYPVRQATVPKGRLITIAPTRNARTVWTINPEPYVGAHFAAMPRALVTRCVLAGSPIGGAVLDPFFGTGTVGQVAESLGRKWFGCELNPEYGKLVTERTAQTGLQFDEALP